MHLCVLQPITLTKVDGTLGMSIVGGINKVCHPFGITAHGIFISKVPNFTASYYCVGLYIHCLLQYYPVSLFVNFSTFNSAFSENLEK